MEFDEFSLVIVETMNRDEASAFILFLGSEILRHKDDITKAEILMKAVAKKFTLKDLFTDE